MHSFYLQGMFPTCTSACPSKPFNQLTLTHSPSYKEIDGYYYGINPLLKDARRGLTMPLSQPNLEVDFPIMTSDAIYKQPQQKKGQLAYHDIRFGQIQYYIDPQLATPFVPHVYVSNQPISVWVHKDPMGQERIEYRRFHPNDELPGCQQETRDALMFREDLMENQSRKRENQKYENLWMFQHRHN